MFNPTWLRTFYVKGTRKKEMGEPSAWPLGEKDIRLRRLCPVCKREIDLTGKTHRARRRSPNQFRMKYAKDFVHPWCWDSMMGGEHVGIKRTGVGEVH